TQGRRLTSVVEMLASQTGAPQTRARVLGERELRKYVGDYTLFMSGLFRTFVERGGFLDYYMEEGKRSYQTVSELDVALYRPGFLMFEELSRSFENYSGALDYMRKCFFKPAPSQDPFAGFAEKIEGWVRLRLTPNCCRLTRASASTITWCAWDGHGRAAPRARCWPAVWSGSTAVFCPR